MILAGGASNVAKVKSNLGALFRPEIIVDTITPEEVCPALVCLR